MNLLIGATLAVSSCQIADRIHCVGNFTMPVTALNLFDTILIILLIPLVDKLIFPAMAKLALHLTHSLLLQTALDVARKDGECR